jgi:hypothetical protein
MTAIRTATIAPKDGGNGKGRSFSALCLATVDADFVSPLGNADTSRPVFAMFAGSDTELRPFMTNLRLGRRCEIGGGSGYRSQGQLELLKSGDYQIAYQREAEGSVASAYLPDLFMVDPGMVDPAGIRFVLLPDKAWLEQEPDDVAEANERKERLVEMAKHARRFADQSWPDQQALVELAPLAYLFVAYLDRRSRCPIVSDPRFYMQILCACLDRGLATFPAKGYGGYVRDLGWGHHKSEFVAQGVESVGLSKPIAFLSSHEDFESLLAAETTQFFTHIEGRVPPKKMPIPNRPSF